LTSVPVRALFTTLSLDGIYDLPFDSWLFVLVDSSDTFALTLVGWTDSAGTLGLPSQGYAQPLLEYLIW
jgi:hypothetical protein